MSACNRFQPDLIIRAAPADWADAIADQTQTYCPTTKHDLAMVRQAVRSHQCNVLVEHEHLTDPNQVLGAVCRDKWRIPNRDRSGQIHDDIELSVLFGLYLIPSERGAAVAPKLLVCSAVEAAFDTHNMRPTRVFGSIDECDLGTRDCLVQLGFQVKHHEEWKLALDRDTYNFARSATESRPANARVQIAKLDHHGVLSATPLYADLVEHGARLPDGRRVARPDRAHGRNAVVQLAVSIGRDYHGARIHVA